MVPSVPWLEQFARQRGARYEPEADDRWFTSWEPFVTLRVGEGYEHSISHTDAVCSRSVARAILPVPGGEARTWLMIAQDERFRGHAAATSDTRSPFVDPLVAMRRQYTGNAAFDAVFVTHAASPEQALEALGPSVQKLLLSWQLPVHVELRPGGLVIAPVTLAADPTRLEWLWNMPLVLAEKASEPRRA